MRKMVRSFYVKAENERLVEKIGYYLDEELCKLQWNGWEILNVFEEKCKGYDYPKVFDSVVFVIVAQREMPDEEENCTADN